MKTQINSVQNRYGAMLIAAVVLVFSPAVFAAAQIYLRADTTLMTMPDGRLVQMWGFAQDSAFGQHDGVVTVPGPELTIDAAETHLIITLENNLPEPVSLMIAGQIAQVSPVSFTDAQGRQRIQSFTHETPPGNTEPVTYEWTSLRAGTFMYQSASHPAVQVQMGLYGCLKKDFSAGPVKQAYDGVEYDQDKVLVFSEIDPALHDAVGANNYGPGLSMTSTMEYKPRYFLINGQAFTSAQTPLWVGQTHERILLRLVNAGIQSHVPVVQYLRGKVVAEDGFKYNYPGDLYAIDMPPAKTKDVVITPTAAGIYPLYDHALRLTNDLTLGGGMMVKLNVAEPAPPAPLAADTPQVSPAETPEGSAPTPATRSKTPRARVVSKSAVRNVEPAIDLDNNGVLDSKDITLFIRYWEARTTLVQNNPADVNGDGLVDNDDVKVMFDRVQKQIKNGRL